MRMEPPHIQAYRRQQVAGAGPGQLLLIVYEQALAGCRRRDRFLARRAVEELVASLDLDHEGAGGLLGVFAAGLGAPFECVVADGAMVSYRYFLEGAQPQPIWLAVPRLLEVIDVSQAVALAAPTPMLVANAVGYARRPLSTEKAQQELSFARDVYRLSDAPHHLTVVAGESKAIGPTVTAFLGASKER